MRARVVLIAFLTLLLVSSVPSKATGQGPSAGDYISPAFTYELVSARKADRIAWIAYEKGERNVYTAAAPDFRPVKVTDFKGDNGIDLTSLAISDDGSIVTFVRGHAANRQGWVANPSSDPKGAERAVWAASTSGGGAWRLSETTTPVLSPDGNWVAFSKDGQIYRTRVSRTAPAEPADKGEEPWIRAWGSNTNPQWSPDGTKLAFVTMRTDHSFIAVYDLKTQKLSYMAPSVDRDTSPAWSPDGRQIAFIRRPGLPFGQQSQAGTGSIGNPPGPAAAAALAGRGGRGGQAGPGGRGAAERPGLTSAAFIGGYTLSFWVADVATGEAREIWHERPGDERWARVNRIEWAGDHITFQAEPEEWIRYYSVAAAGGTTEPVVLTPGEGMVEFTSLSNDGRTLFYCTNAGDINDRNIWKVPTGGGEAVQLTRGEDIETYPAALASGSHVAVLVANWRLPQSVGILSASGGSAKVISPAPPKEFPVDRHVKPTNVVLKAADGLEFHNQLFLPRDLKPGERRPAMIFVHGGPVRQMLLGYHYRFFYHMAYGINQWLADQGYIVLSVNYRSGIGYGRSFRTAPNTGRRGNAEYQDVLAAGQYLQGRPDVDPKRIGIWGLSYGGLLTAQALARNSDIFAAGVDMAGVHLQGSDLDPESVSYQSSAISAIDKWKSPVLLIHGDDDRNVAFQQTTGLVQLLRAHGIYHEVIVYPDEVHDPLVHGRWLYSYERMDKFLKRFLARPSS